MLKRYEDDGKPANDRHIVALCARRTGSYRFQEAMRGTIDNFPVAPVRWLMRAVRVPARRATTSRRPTGWATRCVELVLTPGEVRDRLTRYIFVSNDVNDPTGLLEVTLAKVVAAEAAEKKLDRAIRAGQRAPRARHRLVRRRGQARASSPTAEARAAARGRAARRRASSPSTISIRRRCGRTT